MNDVMLLLKNLTEVQAEAIILWVTRQQENNRFETCQAQKVYKSELDPTLAGFSMLRIYD